MDHGGGHRDEHGDCALRAAAPPLLPRILDSNAMITSLLMHVRFVCRKVLRFIPELVQEKWVFGHVWKEHP